MECSVDGCEKRVQRRSYCSAHYQRFMKYGNPTEGGVMRDGSRQSEPCVIEHCESRRFARSMCSLHYGRWRKHGDPLRTPEAKEPASCSIAGCSDGAMSRGYCASHYGKWRRSGDPLFVSTPATRRRSPGNKDRAGYFRLYLPEHANARKDGYVMEHTVVMVEHLGRPLL